MIYPSHCLDVWYLGIPHLSLTEIRRQVDRQLGVVGIRSDIKIGTLKIKYMPFSWGSVNSSTQIILVLRYLLR